MERTRRLALPFRLLFAVAVLALGGAVLLAATGGLARVADTIGSSFAGFIDDLTATPTPSPTPIVAADAPILEEPQEPYTSQPTVDLVGQVPSELAGDTSHRIRIYVAIADQAPAQVAEIAIGATQRFLVPAQRLVEGPNVFTATIAGPGGESEPSPAVTWVLDLTKPPITLTSPQDGAVVNAASVKLDGTTQARSEVRARNATTNEFVTGEADDNGAFSLLLPIVNGVNDIGLTTTDPAGNQNNLVLSVSRGSGALAAAISSSIYQVKASRLPAKVRLSVLVTDPDGRPLRDARVTFSLAVPGIPAITSKTIRTGAEGTASFATSIPKGATTGQCSVVAIVKTADHGEITDRTIITIVK